MRAEIQTFAGEKGLKDLRQALPQHLSQVTFRSSLFSVGSRIGQLTQKLLTN